MKTIHLLTAVCLWVVVNPVFAQEGQQPEKPDMQMNSSMSMPMHGEKDCEMMSMKNPEKMEEMEEMEEMMQRKQKHMQTMENRLANIEELLKQLVELQKQKGSAQ